LDTVPFDNIVEGIKLIEKDNNPATLVRLSDHKKP
jgi:hypothetical protein